MGYFMREHDVLIGSLLEQLNVRFAPTTPGAESHYGGIEEMAALQTEFNIFNSKRALAKSIAVLNIAAFNNDARNKWHVLISHLKDHKSNKTGLNGEQAIIQTLVDNLAKKQPRPVHFTSHDMRGPAANARVLIKPKDRPIHYIEQDYITISLPMKPFTPPAP